VTEPAQETAPAEAIKAGIDEAQQPNVPEPTDWAATVHRRADELVTLAEDLFDHTGQLAAQCDQKQMADLAVRIAKIKRATRHAIRWADKLDMCVALANMHQGVPGKLNAGRPAHRRTKRSKRTRSDG
jgi:hypothetical protein